MTLLVVAAGCAREAPPTVGPTAVYYQLLPEPEAP
jgi:hypothetical protein